MIISPFTPLFFNSDHKTDGIESEYIQTFATTDRILIQIFDSPYVGMTGTVVNAETGQLVYSINFNTWDINKDVRLYFHLISLSPGYYYVSLMGVIKSDVFRVIDDEAELAKTTLIQYSMKNNRQRNDAVFFIDNMQYFFDFRVHGGFKDSGWSFNVDSEQFVTQHADIAQLYGLESTQKTFTLGGSSGVPIWFGEMLNRILVCSHVYFDTVKYSRKESSVPEVTQQLEGYNSFIFSQSLQQSVNLDPRIENFNQALLRRVDSTSYRTTNSILTRQ